MFKPSSSPFLNEVSQFYTDLSFQPPPLLAPPVPPEEWVSYHPMDAEDSASFAAFRASPAFGQALQQFQDRIAECEAFTRTHFPSKEAGVMLELFEGFRQRLTFAHGETHFGDGLPQLYSRGKLHFDRFCQRLAQDELDLHHRKMVLRELAFHLHACRAQGPAFEEAARRLDRRPGGLQGEFHELLLLHTEALLREVINRPPPGLLLSSEEDQSRLRRLHSMEVHMVNRLRLELGLPGADPHDRFVGADNLVTPQQIQDCRRLLREELRPVMLAQELAERYVEQLREMLPVPLRAPDADLSEHTLEIDRAQQRMEATFGKVPLDHLLDYDVETDRTGWLQDRSLVAYDLLDSLERQGLIVPQPRGSIARDSVGESYWELMQVDWRLFLTEEFEKLDGPRRLMPVQLPHALSWLSRMPAMAPLPALVDAVLASNGKAELQNIPVLWLMDDNRCATFCRRLGEDTLLQWLARQSHIVPSLRGRMLRVLTELRMPAALSAVMAPDLKYDAADCVGLVGGGAILVKAMTSRDPEITSRWFAKVREAIPLMKPAEVMDVFRIGQPGLVGRTLRMGHSGHVRDVLGLLGLAADLRKIATAQLPAMLYAPVQDLMAEGRTRRMTAFGEGLQQLGLRGQLQHLPLCQALAGTKWQRGCSGALRGGHDHTVHWFHQQVRMLLKDGSISRQEAAQLMMSQSRGGASAGLMALNNGHADALAAHLSEVIAAVTDGIIPAHELQDLLACRDADGDPGLVVLMEDEKPHACTAAWRNAVVEAHARDLLTPWQVNDLLLAHNPEGAPLLYHLVRSWFQENRSALWLALIKDLFHAGVLTDPFPVLEAMESARREGAETLMYRLMTNTSDESAIWVLMKLYREAHREQMIDGSDLTQLLLGLSKNDQQTSALASALIECRNGQVKVYLNSLTRLAREGLLSADRLSQLFNGYGLRDRTPLGDAIAGTREEGVACLLAATLKAAQQKLISGEQWARLLRPSSASLTWKALEDCDSERILEDVGAAIEEADEAGLLQGPDGAALLHAWQQRRVPLPGPTSLAHPEPIT